MYQKIRLALLLLATGTVSVFAQEQKGSALVKGTILNQSNAEPVNDVQITIPYLKLLTTSDGLGNFSFSHVRYGTHTIIISSPGIKSDTVKILVNKNVVDLGNILVSNNDAINPIQSGQIPTLVLEESSLNSDDDGTTSQNVSGLLTASRDPFQNTAAYVFGPYRFQSRGYDRGQQQILINGAPMNDIETGDAYFSQWGGLNDVFRSKSSTYGLQPSEYAFGGVNGTVNYDITAANQRAQNRITYSLSNRLYRNRLMLTKSSGLMKNGWAYSVSLSKRWAKEGYVPGTFYDGYSYFAGVSKKMGKKSMLSLSTFGAPTRRGKMAPTYQEAYDLAGSNFYNPNWGYQNGEKRNAKIFNSYQPTTLLNFDYSPSNSFHWNTIVGYQFGKTSNSSLDWYNAPDPRPDYYKYLPSYYLTSDPPDSVAAAEVKANFQKNSQINWNELYQANYLNKLAIPNADGSPSSVYGKRSVYYIGADVDNIKKWTFNTTLQKVLNAHITAYTGIAFLAQHTESYREMVDLLGGDYSLNVNSFTERNFGSTTTLNQNDLNHPYQVIKVGDKYLYDYISRYTKAYWWGQAAFNYNKFDMFISANYGNTSFQRDGLYLNGLYANGNESYGKGAKESFGTYGLKGGITYKMDGRNYLFVNAGIMADAPSFDNTYFSARSRNATVDNPTTEKTQTMEAGYLHRSPKTNIRIVGYATDTKDQVKIQRFFYQGTGSANTMVDYVIQHMNTRNIGTELALEYKINSAFTATGVAAVGQSFYTNNPDVTIHLENTVDAPVKDNVYVKNYYLGVGPQSAYSLGLNYRSKKYWYATVNANYFDRNYIDIAAPRRSEQTVELLTPGSAEWHAILDQQELKAAFTIDINIGKSFMLSKISKKIPYGTFLYFNLGVSNLLDNKEIQTGGFENLRQNYSTGNVDKFAPKYFYGYGRNFFLNVSLKF